MDNIVFEFLALVLLFGPFPIVYMTRGERTEHDVFVFVFSAIGALLLVTFVSILANGNIPAPGLVVCAHPLYQALLRA